MAKRVVSVKFTFEPNVNDVEKFVVEVANIFEEYGGSTVIKDEVFSAVVYEFHYQWGSSDLVKFLNKNGSIEPNRFNDEPLEQLEKLLSGKINEVYLVSNFKEVLDDDGDKLGEQFTRTVITRVG